KSILSGRSSTYALLSQVVLPRMNKQVRAFAALSLALAPPIAGCRVVQKTAPTQLGSTSEMQASPISAQVNVSHPAVQFTGAGKTAGLNYRWTIPGTRPLNILQTIGNGCAFLDYDGDGNPDILLVGFKIALYRGDGKGHFTDVTSETGLDQLKGHFLGCAVGD